MYIYIYIYTHIHILIIIIIIIISYNIGDNDGHLGGSVRDVCSICITCNIVLHVYAYMCIYIYIYREREKCIYVHIHNTTSNNDNKRTNNNSSSNNNNNDATTTLEIELAGDPLRSCEHGVGWLEAAPALGESTKVVSIACDKGVPHDSRVVA